MRQMAMRAFLGVLSSLECNGYLMAKYLGRQKKSKKQHEAVSGSSEKCCCEEKLKIYKLH